jgi:CHAT domain-containing protein
LIEYFTSPETTLVFGVRKDFEEPRMVKLDMPLDDTRRFVASTFARGNMKSLDANELQTRFGRLIEPILSWSQEGDILWIVPHDALHYIPLHALKVEGRYLIERNPVCFTPSASIMKYCRNNRKDKLDTALILADSRGNLPLAGEEAWVVADLLNTIPHIGSAATKSRLLELLQNGREEFDVLHFACHGSFCFDQPLKSGIQLAPENDNGRGTESDADSTLTAEEIFKLSIPANVVTLSCCESGVNANRPGDELIGLTRALIYAGAASIVVSLWQVVDVSTRFLMERFYRELLGGRNKAEALQRAQLHVMNMQGPSVITFDDTSKESGNKCFDHPYYWAPFILVGDWN